jgi:hypothetical protein
MDRQVYIIDALEKRRYLHCVTLRAQLKYLIASLSSIMILVAFRIVHDGGIPSRKMENERLLLFLDHRCSAVKSL